MQVGMAGPYTAKTLRRHNQEALVWNPQGKRGRGRPRNTWRRTVLEEAKGVKKACVEIKTDTKNREMEDSCGSTVPQRNDGIYHHVMV